jgi:hypothetical protein
MKPSPPSRDSLLHWSSVVQTSMLCCTTGLIAYGVIEQVPPSQIAVIGLILGWLACFVLRLEAGSRATDEADEESETAAVSAPSSCHVNGAPVRVQLFKEPERVQPTEAAVPDAMTAGLDASIFRSSGRISHRVVALDEDTVLPDVILPPADAIRPATAPLRSGKQGGYHIR